MTREDAEAASSRLNSEHPERGRFRWLPMRGARGEWTVARVKLPNVRPTGPTTTGAVGKQPSPPDDHPLDLPGGLPPWSAGA
jgi:hypothetical protein